VDQKRVIRKLRALLSADVQGYSRLMGDDEVATVKTITEYRKVFSSIVAQHSGRVVDSPGDNILSEFASVVDAVQCAVEIQKVLVVKNEDLPENRRMIFRIGVNLGDVIHESDRIYGDGVNIAARIEGLADGGGICISGTAYDQIENKLALGYDFIGEHSVKNIAKPVRVYKVLMEPEDSGKMLGEVKKRRSKLKWFLAMAVTVFVITAGVFIGLYWKYLYLPASENIDPENKITFDLPKGPSIAVLPFDNMTGDPGQDFFCDGITENIIAALSNVPKLFVIARNSTFTYKGKSTKAQQVGRELGVQYLIEGSIQKSIDRIRITIQLIETNSGHHKWSEVYDRELDDIFKLQDEITLAILKAININITGGERLLGFQENFTNLQEYLKFLHAMSYFHHMSPENNKLAQKELYEILELNPNIPQAYAYLAHSYIMDLWFGSCDIPLICFGKATEATRKALSLNENDRAAHLAAANLFLMKKEHDKAIAEGKKAIALHPNCADCYALLGAILYYSGRYNEAIAFMKKAILLNPMPYHWYLMNLGAAYTDIGQYDKAIEVLGQSIEIEPAWGTYLSLARVYVHLGYEKEAKEAASELLRLRPDFSIEQYSKIMPYKDQDRIAVYAEALRKAGLPE